MAAVDNPLVGFRVWRVSGGRLRSLAQADEWPGPHPLEARCRRGHVDVPALDCRCGVYAVDSVRTLRPYVGVHDGGLRGERLRWASLTSLAAFCAVTAAGLVWVIVQAAQSAPLLVHLFYVALAVLAAPLGLV